MKGKGWGLDRIEAGRFIPFGLSYVTNRQLRITDP